jgi:hypothetical protein
MLIPAKVGTDSDLIPVTRSDAMPVTFRAKRRCLFVLFELTGIGQLKFNFGSAFILSCLLV